MPLPSVSASLRALARLLCYPDAAVREHLPELRAVLATESELPASRRAELAALLARLESGDALENEADYVQLFDRGRATSLHLFEHVHGDSRDRGPAMIDLLQTYERGGLYLTPGELPDYLPVVLEFFSTQPPAETRAFLGEIAHIVNSIFSALQQCHSPYASVLGAVLELGGTSVQPVKVVPDEPIDKVWEEPEAFAGCESPGQVKASSASGTAVSAQPIHFVRNEAAVAGASNANGASL